MPNLKLQAREIIRAARKHGIVLMRGSSANCAVSVVAAANGIKPPGIWEHNPLFNVYNVATNIAEKTGYNTRDIQMLEAGYESYNNRNNVYTDYAGTIDTNHRYYKVGQAVARLAGLTPR